MTFASRARYWLPLFPLLGLVGVTYWLNQQVQQDIAKPVGKRHDPDAIMENFSAVKMNQQGTPRFIINAKKMLHYPDDDSTELDAPHLTSLSVERPSIHISAQRGVVSSQGDEVFLYNNVKMVREADVNREQLTLLTEYLHAIPDRDLANTDHPVTITDAHNTTHAIGLEMDNKARTLKLLAQVRSEHAPTRK
ncbi:MAG: LPS export ABC transporter periplasmic protein LptC [Gallionellales bacterium GWA2_55_18]|nr:MAG: LPS export ABC transporter periplasmic protein LptC [Gallionellales bacterium GWA2_55_18]